MVTNITNKNLPIIGIEGKAGRFRPVEIEIEIPEEFLVKVGTKNIKNNEGKVVQKFESKMLESPAWDTIGRVLGISYKAPEVKYIDDTSIVFKVRGEYHNENGALIVDETEYHNDCLAIYKKMRLDWRPKTKWINQQPTNELENPLHAGFPKKTVTYDESGMPVCSVVLPEDVEFELLNNLQTLIRNRHKKAETCARRSLVQRAVGQKLANLKPGETRPKIKITKFVAVVDDSDVHSALNDLVGDSKIEAESAINAIVTDLGDDQCRVCGVQIDDEMVIDFSKKRYGKPLCRKCQGGAI